MTFLRLLAFSFLILSIYLPEVVSIECLKCIGNACFNDYQVKTELCADDCFIGFSWYDNTTIIKGCSTYVRYRGVHVLSTCYKSLCNKKIVEAKLVCLHCGWTKEPTCTHTRLCEKPSFLVRDQCFTVISAKKKMWRWGCLGDLIGNDNRYLLRQHMHVIELCDGHRCNEELTFLKNVNISNADPKCAVGSVGSAQVRTCRNPSSDLIHHCYFSTQGTLGCLSESGQSREAIAMSAQNMTMQICVGDSCNEKMTEETVTKCLNGNEMEMCVRLGDSCTFSRKENKIVGTGCQFTQKGFCSNPRNCYIGQGKDFIDVISKSKITCYKCEGESCLVVRDTATHFAIPCPEKSTKCFANNQTLQRGCFDDSTIDVSTTTVCSTDLCNTDYFGTLCLECLAIDPNCPYPNENVQVAYCKHGRECFMYTKKDGSVQRGCSFGYLPEIIFCTEPLCNDMPGKLAACYVFYTKVSQRNNLIRPLEKDWVEHNCPKIWARPLCYMTVSDKDIEGGCSAWIQDFEDKLISLWSDGKVRAIFCDKPLCNYNQVNVKSTCNECETITFKY